MEPETTYEGHKVRIYPNVKQQILLNKTLGCCRFLFNQALAERIQVYNDHKDDKDFLKSYKYKTVKQYGEEVPFLKEVDSQARANAIKQVEAAFMNFYKSLSGKRKGPKMGFPEFKKKKIESSYTITGPRGTVTIDYDAEVKKVKLPIIGKVPFRDGRTSVKGDYASATVSRSPTGKYFISFKVKKEIIQKPIDTIPEKVVGLDMSMSSFYVDSNGNEATGYERLFRKNEAKLAKAQRAMKRKKPGSNNFRKAVLKVSKIHEKITNSRVDFTHKLSTDLIRSNDVIVVEDLNLKGMAQGFKLGKSLGDLGFGRFVEQLEYKAKWYGKELIKADRFFPSSKTCSNCGEVNSTLTLAEREWDCSCGAHHNRDHNAAINLRNYGLNKIGLHKPELKPVESKTSLFDESQNEAWTLKQEPNS